MICLRKWRRQPSSQLIQTAAIVAHARTALYSIAHASTHLILKITYQSSINSYKVPKKLDVLELDNF
jgi:hypothetical protein